MRFTKMCIHVVPMVCAVAVLLTSAACGQSTEKSKGDSTKSVAQAKQLKPQTSCPVTGEAINKTLFTDYNGKRIYVCCESCIAQVKKDPEKYIKKLEAEGQSVETIAATSKKETSSVKADPSMKAMDMKGMKMSGAAATKVADSGYWTCPMHPEIHQAGPGKCPKCGMTLEFKKSEKDTTAMKGMDHSKMKM